MESFIRLCLRTLWLFNLSNKKDNKSTPEFYQVYSPEGELLNQQFEYASDWGTSDVKITSKAKLNNKVFDLSSPNSCQVFIEAHNKIIKKEEAWRMTIIM